jgi:hypothetical protein
MPMRSLPVAVAGLFLVLWYGSAEAAVLTSGVLGCKTPIDANKAETFRAKNDAAGLETFSRPLIAARACIPLAKGVTVDVDQKQPPLSCVRLAGDLTCYWVPDALVNLHPAEKTAGDSSQHSSGGHRRSGGLGQSGGPNQPN